MNNDEPGLWTKIGLVVWGLMTCVGIALIFMGAWPYFFLATGWGFLCGIILATGDIK